MPAFLLDVTQLLIANELKTRGTSGSTNQNKRQVLRRKYKGPDKNSGLKTRIKYLGTFLNMEPGSKQLLACSFAKNKAKLAN